MVISILLRNSAKFGKLWLICRAGVHGLETFKIASSTRADAQRTILRASLAPDGDWMSESQLSRVLNGPQGELKW